MAGRSPAHTAAIYEAINYHQSCAVLRSGRYPHPTWPQGAHGTKGSFGIANDTLTSIRVGPDTTIRIYDAAAQISSTGSVVFVGPSISFTADQPDVSVYGWNDRTSAIEVF